MKREDLKALGLEDDVIEKVLTAHGKDMAAQTTSLTTTQAELETLKGQLTDANAAIESFKAMKPEELKVAADDWKVKYEKATTESAAQLANLKFDHALESALVGAKVKNAKAVSALLSTKNLKLTDDGKILGLDEQLTKIKSENDYLFTDETPVPKIVTGGNSQSVIGVDAMETALRQGAGLPLKP